VDLIKKVGSGKDFLGQKHTRSLQHQNPEGPASDCACARVEARGGRDATAVALEAARHILETLSSPPAAGGLAALERIVAEVEAEVAHDREEVLAKARQARARPRRTTPSPQPKRPRGIDPLS
jgi:trimethylamine:corrinoid methyltransferase-like protein